MPCWLREELLGYDPGPGTLAEGLGGACLGNPIENAGALTLSTIAIIQLTLALSNI